MKKALKRFLAFAMVCITILSLSVSASAYQTKSSNFSKDYTLTGDSASNLVAVAKEQLGKKQSQLGYSEAWCADFVLDCARLAGISTKVIPYDTKECAACTNLYNKMTNSCGATKVSSPKKGDLVFYYCYSCGRYVHVGIIETNSTTSIEGNNSNKVREINSYYFSDAKGHSVSSGTIRRDYLRPNYSSSSSSSSSSGTTAKAALTINLTSYPTSITKSNSFGLKGTISSGYKIKEVKGYVINSKNKTVLSSTDTPNSTSLNIQTANLNKKLTFNTLDTGTYTLKIEVTDTAGRTKTVSKSFTVVKSTLKVNLTSYPSSIKKGSAYGLRGTVSSNVKVTKVQGYVINSKGKTVLSSTDTPNSTSMNIKTAKLNSKLTFNTLSAGTYTLKIVATDASGNSVTWSKTFKVTK